MKKEYKRLRAVLSAETRLRKKDLGKEEVMIKIMYSSEKTNSFRPTPWNWSVEPFLAFRGAGARYSAFQPVANGYKPKFDGKEPSADGYSCPNVSVDNQPSRLIKTQKGTLLVVPCSKEQDEKLMLVTLRGGFRGNYSRIKAVGAEILSNKSGNMHCCPTGHLVVRLTDPKGYLFAETGRRCGTGLVEIFSWDGYKTMPTEEFNVWQEKEEKKRSLEKEIPEMIKKTDFSVCK